MGEHSAGQPGGCCAVFFFLPRLELSSSIDRDSLACHCVLISGLPNDGRQTNCSKKKNKKKEGESKRKLRRRRKEGETSHRSPDHRQP